MHIEAHSPRLRAFFCPDLYDFYDFHNRFTEILNKSYFYE